jgi:hypothetical protein
MVTFPVSQLRSKYQRTQGEGRAKTAGEKSFDIKSEEFDDGYEAKLVDLYQQSFSYRRWQQAPAALVAAEAIFRQRQIALKLEAGETIPFLDTGKFFFSATHLANLFDPSVAQFSNYQATPTAITVPNLEAEATAMKNVRDENGDKMGVKADTILVPTEKGESTKNLLKKEMIAEGSVSVSNPYMNGFTVIEVPEFTDVDDWYLVDSKLIATGVSPWVSLRQNMPSALALRIFDESSDRFKETGRLRIQSHIWYGFALALPHAIRKIKGA